MLANILAIPFVTATLLFLYLAWEKDTAYAYYMVPPLIIATVIYIMAPQINWWWYMRRPPALPEPLRQLLERFCTFYKGLDAAGQKRFRDRVALFQIGTDWMAQGWGEDEKVPPDVTFALAVSAVTLSFREEEFLFHKFEKVIVYPMPFPTEEYQFAHASELYEPDGCLLFSAEQVMRALAQPEQWYNVGMHEYARAFVLTYPQYDYPQWSDETAAWEQLEQASGMSRAHVEAIIGIAGLEPLPVAIHHYFIFPERFRAAMPDTAAVLDRVFGVWEVWGLRFGVRRV